MEKFEIVGFYDKAVFTAASLVDKVTTLTMLDKRAFSSPTATVNFRIMQVMRATLRHMICYGEIIIPGQPKQFAVISVNTLTEPHEGEMLVLPFRTPPAEEEIKKAMDSFLVAPAQLSASSTTSAPLVVA